VRLSDLVVAVAGLLFATDPALAALLAASPRPTLDTNVRVLEWAITVDGSHVTAKIVLAREGTSTGRMGASVGLGPVGVMGFPVGLEIKGPSEGSWTIGTLILLLRIIRNQLNFLVMRVWLGGSGRGRDGARRSEGSLATNDWALNLGARGGGVVGHRRQHGGDNRKGRLIIRCAHSAFTFLRGLPRTRVGIRDGSAPT